MHKEPQSRALPVTLEHFDKLPDSARVRLPLLCLILGISEATAWRMAADGRLSKPIRLGGTTGWTVGAIRAALHGGVV
jgi:predicted DNA-binding transcriptional regulator AlpA